MFDAPGVMMETAKAMGFRVSYVDDDGAIGGHRRSSWALEVRNPKNGRKLSVIQSFPCYDNETFETWHLGKDQPKAHQELRTVLRKIANLR